MTEHPVRSPLPGIFYRGPSPNELPFTEVGEHVTAEQTIGLVEVMKTFSEVKAATAGRVASFEVEDGAIVSPGDVIATIDAG